MKNNILDALKALGKLLGIIVWLIGYLPFKSGEYLTSRKFSVELEAEKALLLAEAEKNKPKKKRVVRKKKVAEIVENKEINS